MDESKKHSNVSNFYHKSVSILSQFASLLTCYTDTKYFDWYFIGAKKEEKENSLSHLLLCFSIFYWGPLISLAISRWFARLQGLRMQLQPNQSTFWVSEATDFPSDLDIFWGTLNFCPLLSTSGYHLFYFFFKWHYRQTGRVGTCGANRNRVP